MNSAPQSSRSRRRIWPWLLAVCLAPVVILGAVAVSFLTLDRDATLLRKQVMAATHAGWQTKVQLSVGRFTLGAVRTGLSFVKNRDIADARLALQALQHASVGVYQRKSAEGESGSREKLFTDTDEAMGRRGWSRLVGVIDKKDTVLVYVPSGQEAAAQVDLCVAVVNDHELVIVSATVNADELAALVRQQAGDDLKRGLKLAKF